MSRVLCILGMHRSGTSVVANLLHESGLHLGERLLGADFSNKRGHFEDLDFLDLHKEVLEGQGLDPSGLELERLPVSPEDFRARIQVLKDQRSSLKQWGWKDPRTVLFISEYMEAIPEMKILLVLRNYRLVLRSLVNRDLARARLSGRTERLKWKAFGRALKKGMLREILPGYQKTIEVYYSNLLELLKNGDPEAVQPMILKDFKSTPGLFEKLESWGFQLSPISMGQIVDNKFKAQSFLELEEIDPDPQLESLEEEIHEILRNRYSTILV